MIYGKLSMMEPFITCERSEEIKGHFKSQYGEDVWIGFDDVLQFCSLEDGLHCLRIVPDGDKMAALFANEFLGRCIDFVMEDDTTVLNPLTNKLNVYVNDFLRYKQGNPSTIGSIANELLRHVYTLDKNSKERPIEHAQVISARAAATYRLKNYNTIGLVNVVFGMLKRATVNTSVYESLQKDEFIKFINRYKEMRIKNNDR